MQCPGQDPFLLMTLWRGGSLGGKGPFAVSSPLFLQGSRGEAVLRALIGPEALGMHLPISQQPELGCFQK